jgi:hypothetical protein
MDLTDEELRSLIGLARRAIHSDSETKRALQSAGVNVTPANFYSSVPLVADVEGSFEYDPGKPAPYLTGDLFNPARIEEFAKTISRHADDFDPPQEGDPDKPDGFFWKNPAFSYCDAMAYYCILREFRPRRVVEIGSGFSTLVADQALRDNGEGELIVIEPYPKPFLRQLATVSELIERPVQEIPEADLVGLIDSSQIWFIDSTHTVKTGSDCLYIYLKIMPQLRTRVLCHSHDIYLPYALPAAMALKMNIFWTEQYLLQAYLLDNPKAQVVFGSRYVHQQMRQVGIDLMRGRSADGGASLWYWIDPTLAA